MASPTKHVLKNKIKNLHQKIRCQNKKIRNLSQLLHNLEEKKLLEKDTKNFLIEQFEGLPLELF